MLGRSCVTYMNESCRTGSMTHLYTWQVVFMPHTQSYMKLYHIYEWLKGVVPYMARLLIRLFCRNWPIIYGILWLHHMCDPVRHDSFTHMAYVWMSHVAQDPWLIFMFGAWDSCQIHNHTWNHITCMNDWKEPCHTYEWVMSLGFRDIKSYQKYEHGVATISRLQKIIGLFCRM